MTATIIDEWRRKDGEVVRVSLDEFNGRPTVDIRTWWCDTEGVWRPGKSGFTVSRAHLDRLADALVKARDHERTTSRQAAE
jgi:hypothetical protein